VNNVPNLQSKQFQGMSTSRYWWIRRPRPGRSDRDHDIAVFSRLSIALWAALGIGLIVFGVWLFHLVWPIAIAAWIVGLGAEGSAFGRWRERRWLRAPKHEDRTPESPKPTPW
jgi:hypothetical protein